MPPRDDSEQDKPRCSETRQTSSYWLWARQPSMRKRVSTWGKRVRENSFPQLRVPEDTKLTVMACTQRSWCRSMQEAPCFPLQALWAHVNWDLGGGHVLSVPHIPSDSCIFFSLISQGRDSTETSNLESLRSVCLWVSAPTSISSVKKPLRLQLDEWLIYEYSRMSFSVISWFFCFHCWLSSVCQSCLLLPEASVLFSLWFLGIQAAAVEWASS